MREASLILLDALTEKQQKVATFEFSGSERYLWNYTPVKRDGLRLKDMNAKQRRYASALMATGLSVRGSGEARQIIDLETTLGVWEGRQEVTTSFLRDPELYYFSIFGDPASKDPWAWRVGGHHMGLHFTVIDREIVSPLPLFFGANPAEVRHGPEIGKRILAQEEDLARTVLGSLNAPMKARAICDSVPPDDILTKNYRTATRNMPLRGISFSAMEGVQRNYLMNLIRHYVDRTVEELASNEWKRIESAGLEAITFAWAGSEDLGKAHYYSVVGPQFLIEYDNTQNGGNHIHSVWRGFEHDWGEDLLGDHYSGSSHH